MGITTTIKLLESELTAEEYTISGLASQLGLGYSTVHRWVMVGKKKIGSRDRISLQADIGRDGGIVIKRDWVLEFYQGLREDIAA